MRKNSPSGLLSTITDVEVLTVKKLFSSYGKKNHNLGISANECHNSSPKWLVQGKRHLCMKRKDNHSNFNFLRE